MTCRWLVVAALASCTRGTPPPSSTVRTPEVSADVHVYAWTGTELAGLYCRVAGALEQQRCVWPDRVVLRGEPPDARPRRVIHRDELDGSGATVVAYGDAGSMALVVQSSHGSTIWIESEGTVRRTLDQSGVAAGPPPALLPIGVKGESEPAAGKAIDSYEAHAIATLDLDADAVEELVYRGLDDGGAFVAAEERSGDGFVVRVRADDEASATDAP